MLIIKLTLVPFSILLVSLAVRRWGNHIGGLLSGLPIVAGPITFFLAYEQGSSFAVESSKSGILGVVALSTFCFTYSWCCLNQSWLNSLVIGWLGFALVSCLIIYFPCNMYISILLAIATILIQIYLLPKYRSGSEAHTSSSNEVVAKMFSSAIIVILVTTLANTVGPRASGVFALFPVIATIMAVFTHVKQSSSQVVVFLRGLMVGLIGLSAFYFLVAFCAMWYGFYYSFMISLCTLMVIQAGVHQFTIKKNS